MGAGAGRPRRRPRRSRDRRSRCAEPSGAPDDPLDRRGELWRVGRVAAFDGVVEYDPIIVVDQLALVAELDRAAQSAPGDRAAVAVVQLTRRVAPSGAVPAGRWRV
jgi:hypothetical protein